MKRLITFILVLVCVLGLGSCNKTANIDFPFDVEDVENNVRRERTEEYSFNILGFALFLQLKKIIISFFINNL